MADNFTTIDASGLASIDYAAYIASYYSTLGTTTGTATFYGGTKAGAPFNGYFSGSQLGIRFTTDPANDAQILVEGADLQYDGLSGVDGSYSGDIDSVTFGRFDANTTFTQDDVAGTRSELTGVIPGLVVSNLGISEDVGGGTDKIVFTLRDALKNSTVTADKIDTIYDIFAAKAQHFIGSAGNDTYVGTEFGDLIDGGAGADALDGGAGADTFEFVAGDLAKAIASTDTITGFKGKEGDRLDFTGFDADTTKKGIQDFDFIGNDAFSKDGAEIRVQVKGGETYVYLNTDHDKAAEFVLHLDGEVKVKEAFFEL